MQYKHMFRVLQPEGADASVHKLLLFAIPTVMYF